MIVGANVARRADHARMKGEADEAPAPCANTIIRAVSTERGLSARGARKSTLVAAWALESERESLLARAEPMWAPRIALAVGDAREKKTRRRL